MGRPAKGDDKLVPIAARVHPLTKAELEVRAAEKGWRLSRYVGMILDRAAGR